MTPETNPEKERMEEETTAGFPGSVGDMLDGNRGHEKGSEERLTPETETKREEHSVVDMVRDLDKDEVMGEGGPNLETNVESKTVKTVLTDDTTTLEKFQISDQMDKLKQDIMEEERESRLVAGISLHEETRGDAYKNEEKINQRNVGEKGGDEEREKREEAEDGGDIKNANHNELAQREMTDHVAVSDLTPPLSTSSTQLGKEFEIPTSEIITQSQNPPGSPPPVHHRNVPPSLLVAPTQVPPVSSHPPSPHAKVSPQISVSTVAPGEVLLEDLLAEVLQGPGHHLKQNELEVKASPNLEDIIVKHILFKPAQKELQTTREINSVQLKEGEFIPKVQPATPKPNRKTKDLTTKEPNSTPKSNENNPTSKPVEFTRKPNTTQPTGEPKTVKLMENDTELTIKRNKASPPRPQLTKPSVKPLLTTAKTPPYTIYTPI